MFVFAAAIFRSEVALLLGTSILYLLLVPTTSLQLVIPPFIISFAISLLVSIPLDSYFWQKPLWPELWGFYYNAIQGSSSDWGVSPWYYYFVSALPRLLLNPMTFLVLLPLSLSHPALRPAANRLVIPSLLFVAIYSLQPHKEARFIFYVVPPLTAASALGANFLFNRAFSPKKNTGSIWSILLVLLLLASILLSFLISTGMLLISSLNYPGGEALSFLRDTVLQSEGVSSISQSSSASTSAALIPAHADVLSCMTGVTLFGTATGLNIPNYRGGGRGNLVRSNIKSGNSNENTETTTTGSLSSGDAVVTLALDKTEDESVLLQPDFWTRFDYALAENPEKVRRGGEWDIIGVVKGFGGVEIVNKRSADSDDGDEDSKDMTQVAVVGRAAIVEQWKRRIMNLTGGRWVGPKMVPKIYILKRVKEGKSRSRKTVDA